MDSKRKYYKAYLKDEKMEGEGEMEIINKSIYKGNLAMILWKLDLGNYIEWW